MKIYFILIFALISGINAKSDTSVRVCVAGKKSPKESRDVKSCETLARSKRIHASCVFAATRLDCLRLVADKKADMTVLEPEDLLVVDPSEPVVVVSEIRLEKDVLYRDSAVVLVRKGAGVSPNLRNAKLCHPGWIRRDGVSNLFTQYLELRLAAQNCRANLSLFEDRIRTSASYFGFSCKAGQWSTDKDEDLRLKNLYPSMCTGCESSTCTERDKYWGSGGAVTCFKDADGDALWATLADVREHFQEEISVDDDKYEYLCEDRTTMRLQTQEPCIWLARPWSVVVANDKAAMNVQKALAMVNDSTDWDDNLLSIFLASKAYVVNMESPQSPEMYAEKIPGFKVGNEMAYPNCNPSHRVLWCTTSLIEEKKCESIAKIATAFTVAPKINCLRRSSIEQCVQAVADKEADITVVPADYNPHARLKGLEALYYEGMTPDSMYSISGIIKNSSESSLRHKKACFTRQDGLAWRAAIVNLRKEEEISSSCGSTGLLQNYFSSICITAGEGDLPYCCDKRNDADPEAAALDCLAKEGCDVAFVNTNVLYRNSDGKSTEPWTKGLKSSDYRTICRRGSFKIPQNQNQECGWVLAPASAIMASANLDQVKRSDLNHVLSEIARLFTRSKKHKTLPFSVFGPFQDHQNVLFQDTSVQLTRYLDKGAFGVSMDGIIESTTVCSSGVEQKAILFVTLLSLIIQMFR